MQYFWKQNAVDEVMPQTNAQSQLQLIFQIKRRCLFEVLLSSTEVAFCLENAFGRFDILFFILLLLLLF